MQKLHANKVREKREQLCCLPRTAQHKSRALFCLIRKRQISCKPLIYKDLSKHRTSFASFCFSRTCKRRKKFRCSLNYIRHNFFYIGHSFSYIKCSFRSVWEKVSDLLCINCMGVLHTPCMPLREPHCKPPPQNCIIGAILGVCNTPQQHISLVYCCLHISSRFLRFVNLVGFARYA